VRIIAGRYRGRQLTAVGKGDTKSHLRPTSDKVRESLFNILINGSFGDVVSNARVLDLFAGTGALGIEAVSRGATCARLVDSGRVAAQLIQKNMALLGNPDNLYFSRLDALALPRNSEASYGLIFLDPPYGKNLAPQAIASAQKQGWIDPNGVIICEDNVKIDPPAGFEHIQTRTFGETVITVMRADPQTRS